MRPFSKGLFQTALFCAVSGSLQAAPPLVTGDVPTADKGRFEWSLGTRYQKNGGIERQIPASELVYGVTDRWELSLETPGIRNNDRYDLGDIAIANKVVLLPENDRRPGISGSYEWKLDNGDAVRGFGSGGQEHEFRLRTQKTFGWFTPLINIGYTVVPDVSVGGVRTERQNTWRASFAQEWRVSKKTALLSELYWKTADTLHDPDRLAWNAGVKYQMSKDLSLRFAIGKSIREHSTGGPEMRIYAGLQWVFDAPWRK